MSSSPGAYVTSLPQQVWIRVSRNQFVWYVYGTYTANTSYVTSPPWHEMPGGAQYIVTVDVVVTSVSGTSPTMTVSISWADAISSLFGAYNWVGWFTIPSSGSITSTGTYGYSTNSNMPVYIQANVNIGGTSPSFTAYIVIWVGTH